jgi:uncharacterized membrane protein YhaH (DUF805 family)
MKWYLKVIRDYAVFAGRSRRKEFWMFTLINIIISILAMLLDSFAGWYLFKPDQEGLGIFYSGGVLETIYQAFILIPSISVTVRRLHDRGKSGWNFLIVLIPIIGTIWVLIECAMDSIPGENQYGPNPKGVMVNVGQGLSST